MFSTVRCLPERGDCLSFDRSRATRRSLRGTGYHVIRTHARFICDVSFTHPLFLFLPRLDVRGVSRIRQRRRRRRRLGDVVPVATHSGQPALVAHASQALELLGFVPHAFQRSLQLGFARAGLGVRGIGASRASNASSVRRNVSLVVHDGPAKRSGRRETPLPVIGRKAFRVPDGSAGCRKASDAGQTRVRARGSREGTRVPLGGCAAF